MPSVDEMIFPIGEPRDGYILRLELVGSWESQFLGLGRLVAFLTPRLLAEAHAVDDMGVNVVFLQRHRVEVGLKLILERAGVSPVGSHNIDSLWKRCAEACAAAGVPSCWDTFDHAQREFAQLLDRVDPDAATFRYPVDKDNQSWERGNVDLVALEKAGVSFERDLLTLVRELAAAESLPIAEDDALETAEELRALIVQCRSFIQKSREVVERLREQRQALRSMIPGSRTGAPDRGDDEYAEFEALAEASEPMVRGTEEFLERVVATYEIELTPLPVAAPIELPPLPNPLDSPLRLKETFNALIKWLADQMIRQLRPLTVAVNAVYRRSESWETPAARQVHLDVTRFRSRLVRAQAPKALTHGHRESS
jgi:hypothetical protein